MPSTYEKFGIAQLVLYSLVIPFPAYLTVKSRGKLRVAWCFIFAFCSIRMAMAILELVYEHTPKLGVAIGISVLSGIGMGPLLITITLILWHTMSKWFSSKPIWTRLLLALRLLFVVAISLISAGGVVKGTADSTSQMRVGDDLVKAGYVILATIVAALFVVEVVIWRDHPALSFNITMTIAVAAFATILMAIRLVYGLLMVFDPTSRTWRGVQGSTAAYALMSLLPEYLVTVSLTAVGMMVASTL